MNNQETELKNYIDRLIHKMMVVENGFLETQAAGLTHTEMKVIKFIGDKEKCIMREISDYLLINKNNLTAIANKLTKKKLIKRERTEEDRRIVYVSLTKKGEEIYRQEVNSYLELSRGMLKTLNQSERKKFLELMNKITS